MGVDAKPQASPAKPSGEGRETSFVKRAGAIVGLISAVAVLVFLFFPEWKPGLDSPKRSATLSELTLVPTMPFRQYLARIDQPTTPYTPAQLARRGAFVQFRVSATGFAGQELILKWELFDVASGEQVDESKATALKPTNETTEAMWPFWIPLPSGPGPFYAIVELLEQKEHQAIRLDTEQTAEFPGAAG